MPYILGEKKEAFMKKSILILLVLVFALAPLAGVFAGGKKEAVTEGSVL